MRRSNDPIGAATVKMIMMWDRMSESARAAHTAASQPKADAIAERTALQNQLLEIERQLRNINPLPPSHPAHAGEQSLIDEAAALRVAIDAVVIPSAPWDGIRAEAIAAMWRNRG